VCVCVCFCNVLNTCRVFIPGTIQTPLYNGAKRLLTNKGRLSLNLTIPTQHTLFVSFPQEQLQGCVKLLAVHRDNHDDNDGEETDEDEFCCNYPSVPLTYNTSVAYMTVQFWYTPDTKCTNAKPIKGYYQTTGFQMHFSFVAPSAALKVLPSGLWNCSVPHWSQLKRHFPCNLRQDCEAGEDETYCPYYRYSTCRHSSWIMGLAK
jgi:hypothetical protein